MSPLKRSNNWAARMGRWSASHWKTAVFGWLAFVVLALAIGNVVGTKNIKDEDANVGQAHRADKILKENGSGRQIRRPRSSHPEPDADGQGARVPDTVDDVVRSVEGVLDGRRTCAPPSTPGTPTRSRRRSHRHGQWDMKGNVDTARNVDAITATTAKVAKQHPGVLRRRGRRRSAPAKRSTRLHRSAQAGRRAFDPAHARSSSWSSSAPSSQPASRCCSRSPPSWPRSAWSHCRATSCRWIRTSAPSSCSSGSPSASTTRSSTSSASVRSELPARATGRTRGCRRHVRPIGAHLGLTVMVAMAGMLFSGDKTYLSFGDRDDDRRRGRDARLADRAPGAALEARRQGREGPDPVPRPAPPRERREPDLGGDPDAGAPPPVVSAIAAAAVLARARRSRCCTSTPPRPGSTRCRRARRPSATIDKIQDRVPGRRRPGARRDPGRHRLAASRSGDRRAEDEGARERPDAPARSRSTSTRRTRSHASRSRSNGNGTDATSTQALADAP